jgi:hypothetical protein
MQHFVALSDIRVIPMLASPLGRTGKVDRCALRAQTLQDDADA